MDSKRVLRAVGIASLTIMLVALAFDGVDRKIVLALATAVVAVAAPDVLERIKFGPF